MKVQVTEARWRDMKARICNELMSAEWMVYILYLYFRSTNWNKRRDGLGLWFLESWQPYCTCPSILCGSISTGSGQTSTRSILLTHRGETDQSRTRTKPRYFGVPKPNPGPPRPSWRKVEEVEQRGNWLLRTSGSRSDCRLKLAFPENLQARIRPRTPRQRTQKQWLSFYTL
jgi:hypothetical protein